MSNIEIAYRLGRYILTRHICFEPLEILNKHVLSILCNLAWFPISLTIAIGEHSSNEKQLENLRKTKHDSYRSQATADGSQIKKRQLKISLSGCKLRLIVLLTVK